jgi:hypothetical protein
MPTLPRSDARYAWDGAFAKDAFVTTREAGRRSSILSGRPNMTLLIILIVLILLFGGGGYYYGGPDYPYRRGGLSIGGILVVVLLVLLLMHVIAL